MHSAPAVRYPVARSAHAGLVLLGVWSLAAVACLWWWRHGGAAIWPLVGALGVCLLGALLAFVQWHGMRAGALRWDGQAWWWQFAHEDEVAVSIQVRLDLQHGVLLQLAGRLSWRARWCYLERTREPTRWADLRRALYSPHPFASAPTRSAPLPP